MIEIQYWQVFDSNQKVKNTVRFNFFYLFKNNMAKNDKNKLI